MMTSPSRLGSSESVTAAAMRRSRDDGYGRSSRFYDIPEVGRFPSVTTVLQAVAKPALVNWAARVEREMILEAATRLYEDLPAGTAKMSAPAYRTSLEKRLGIQKAHQKELQKAADIGSGAHALIEWNLRRELGQRVGPEPRVQDKSLWAFMAYEDWRKGANLAVRWVEQVVYSRTHGYAGTADWAGEIDSPAGRIVALGDWKTGKAIYPEMEMQLSAYITAGQEMGHLREGTWGAIVRLPKVETDPEFEVRLVSPEKVLEHFEGFLHVLGVWHWMERQRGEAA